MIFYNHHQMFDISQTTTALTPELTHSPASSVESSPLLSVPAYIPPPKMSTSPAQLALLEADAWFTSIDYLEPYQPPVQSYAYPQYDFPPSPPSSYYDYNYLLPPAKMYHSHPSVSTYAASAPIAHKSSSASSTSSGSSASSSGPGPVRRFQCPQCNRAFARHFNMKQHMETHNPMRVKPFLCEHSSCGKRFSRKHDLLRHQTSIHQKHAKNCTGCCTNSTVKQEIQY